MREMTVDQADIWNISTHIDIPVGAFQIWSVSQKFVNQFFDEETLNKPFMQKVSVYSTSKSQMALYGF